MFTFCIDIALTFQEDSPAISDGHWTGNAARWLLSSSRPRTSLSLGAQQSLMLGNYRKSTLVNNWRNKGKIHKQKQRDEQRDNHLPESRTISQFKPPTFMSHERRRRPSPTTSTASGRQQIVSFLLSTISVIVPSVFLDSPCPCSRRLSMFPSGPVESTWRHAETKIVHSIGLSTMTTFTTSDYIYTHC